MTRVGITGHTDLTEDTTALVAVAMRVLLNRADPPLVGVSCLARGADQVFAEVVLEVGGRLEVVLPAADYREQKVAPADAARFDRLVGRAAVVRVMPFRRSGRPAYRAANEAMLAAVDRLLAVWDGEAGGSSGGTTDVVRTAHRRGLPVTVVWPEGARRG